MKKNALATAVALSLGTGVAQSYPIYDFAFSGTFSMYDPSGQPWGSNNCSPGPWYPGFCNDPAVYGSMSIDMANGSGTASIAPSVTFSGYMWTAHNIAIQMVGPSTAMASMLFDWAGNLNIPVAVDFSMTLVGPATATITTLDGGFSCGLDGIPGCPMASGPFPGWNATFGGTMTHTSIDVPPPLIPVPATAWLFGSGMIGLVAVSRRKKAA